MTDTPQDSSGQPPVAAQSSEAALAPVVVKKYANRRLYNTETSSYITLDNLAEMIRGGRDFVVYDAKSGEDITRGVLTQIIVEEEGKGTAMLPTTFLRQLIGFYGGSLQGVVPRYLEHTMASFARQQQQVRQMMERTLSPFLPTGVEEMSRQNMVMFERAISMWNPFHRASEPDTASQAEPSQAEPSQAEPESGRAAARPRSGRARGIGPSAPGGGKPSPSARRRPRRGGGAAGRDGGGPEQRPRERAGRPGPGPQRCAQAAAPACPQGDGLIAGDGYGQASGGTRSSG